jgi:DNA (cytosine-5)-methyltransferase 1
MQNSKKKTLTAVDLYCGSGGSSTGLVQAAKEKGYKVKLLAINHWQVAVATHSANHPDVEHLCTGVDQVDPRQLQRDGVLPKTLDLLWASPECTYHSRARGGKPIDDQKRATAWCVIRWIEALMPSTILVENVPDFESWGPLKRITKNGKHEWVPDPKRKGEIFLAWVKAIESFGYSVDWQVCNSADFGAATARERLFIQARKGRKKIQWPEPTHVSKKQKAPTLFTSSLQSHRPASEIIDWSKQGRSIYFDPKYIKKPLAENTLSRIYAGLHKYSGLPFFVPQYGGDPSRTESIKSPLSTIVGDGGKGLVQPIIVILKGQSIARGIDSPLPTLTTEGHLALAQAELKPFTVGVGGPQGGQAPRSTDEPLRTVLTKNHQGIVQPYFIKYYQGSDACSIDEPLPTITANYEHMGLVQPCIIKYYGNDDASPIDYPLPTVTCNDRFGLMQPYLVILRQHADAQSVDEPVRTICAQGQHIALAQPNLLSIDHTSNKDGVYPLDRPLPVITSKNRFAISQAFLMKYHGSHQGRSDGNARVHPLDEPLRTLDTSNRMGLVQPFLIAVNHQGGERSYSVENPLPTLTTKNGLGLVEIELQEGDELALLDIRFRMLEPDELSAAMGFPKKYFFTGTKKDKVKQIGNAVEVNTARALCQAVIG